MGQPRVLEGVWEAILARSGAELAGRTVRVYVQPEMQEVWNLDEAISRLLHRTPNEIDAARNRLIDAAPEPQPLPEGKTLADVIMGQWPGTETDAEINEALRKLS